jgi:catechol 2,3-dioxygenase-like lactoylglutathione lyase family enzyme
MALARIPRQSYRSGHEGIQMREHFKRVGFTVYPVKDMKRARDFYEGVLGLKPGESFQDAWQEYDFGGTCFAITSMIAEFVKPGTQGSVAFEVSDLPALVKKLRAKDVKFAEDELMDTPVCKMAFMKDPDGNTVSLHQLKE